LPFTLVSDTAYNPRSRVVVIEFSTYDAAMECHLSPEYAKAKVLREGKAISDLAIVPSYDGPQLGESADLPTAT
jgi:uncharacterized protein (DUF1330 family)